MLDTLLRGGEGWRADRTGSSMVMVTPDLCWLMERRTGASPLGVTGGGVKHSALMFGLQMDFSVVQRPMNYPQVVRFAREQKVLST